METGKMERFIAWPLLVLALAITFGNVMLGRYMMALMGAFMAVVAVMFLESGKETR